jgi:ATP-dependent DNA ligase
MRPMLARTLGPKFDSFPCYVQPKLNGIRALYQGQIFQSRDEKLWNNKVLAHLVEELQCLGSPIPILDGELYVHGWRLQDINAAIAVNRKEPTDKTPHVCFHVFDVVDPNRKFSDRWFEIYHGLLSAELPHIKAVPTALCNSREEMEQHFHLYTREGYEGIMLRPDGPYEFGEHMAKHGRNMTTFRSKYLVKHKQWQDDEFVCVGVTQGEGKADIGVGALVCKATR